MGWSSGTEIFQAVIEAAKKHIPDTEDRKQFYADIYPAFREQDWDTEGECFDDDPLFEEVYCETWNMLTSAETIWMASAAFALNMSLGDLKKINETAGKEAKPDDVWGDVWYYVEEIQEDGVEAFRERYGKYKMHPSFPGGNVKP